ncbi:MAG: PilZ domain-containing protein [Desulfobacterales bacterium]|nr:MAG: PilZ domain-containing protein [Desulfobacterales bacterium]UCD91061.1 MAG: PilZ domain-containing protein [Desulfobacterales bacterium]
MMATNKPRIILTIDEDLIKSIDDFRYSNRIPSRSAAIRRLLKEALKKYEKRKHPRTKTKNLVSYVGLDDYGNEKEQGMGKTLDISIGGILLETHFPIVSNNILLTATGTKGELINVEGKIVLNRTEDSGMYRIGIQFLEDNEKTRLFITSLIKAFSKQKT